MHLKPYEYKGKTYLQVQLNLGKDPLTNKTIRLSRRKDDDGHRFENERQAKLFEAKKIIEFENGEITITPNVTYKQLYEDWLNKRYVGTVRETTLNHLKSDFRLHILPEFGKSQIKNINKYKIESWIHRVSKEMVLYRQLYNYFKRVMEYAVQNDLIHSNPCDKVHVPPKGKKSTYERKFYEKETLIRFLECVKMYEPNPMWFYVYHTLAFTGIRVGECCALHWKDIDFERKELNVSKTLVIIKDEKNVNKGIPQRKAFQPPKNGDSRIIPLSNGTIKLLKEWKSIQAKLYLKLGFNTMHKDQLIFPNWKNEPMHVAHFATVLREILKKHDELPPITPHGFRHTHCSLLFSAGVPIKTVQERLGHKTAAVTLDVYAHVMKKDRLQAVEKLDNLMGNT